MDARNADLTLPQDDRHASEAGPGARSGIGIAEVVDTLRRGWRFPVFGCLIGLALALAYVATASAPYKSSARILIDRSVNRYLQTNRIIDQPTFDDNEIASQIYVLSSDSVVVPVVRSLKLTEDSEFAGTKGPGGVSLLGALANLKESLKSIIGRSDSAADREAARERLVVEGVLKNLTVKREDVANVINLSFESRDPVKAATIANALADTYLSTTLDARLKSTQIVSQWLQDRLTELRTQVTEADRALQEFKVANNLLTEGRTSQNSELFTTLRTQLASARLAAAEAKQRLDLIQRADAEGVLTAVGVDALLHGSRSGTINFALNNTDLVRLRTQYRDMKAREADLAARLGPTHAVIVKLRQQMDAVRAAIRSEEQRIADVYASEYEVAKAREAELAASVEKLAGQIGGGSQTQAKLRDLESSAETLRNLYNTFLQKFKEVHTAQTEVLPLQNARIITRAVAPNSKSSKKALVVLAGSTMFGLLLGFGIIVGREWAADVFRSAKAVERITDRKCVVLPKVEAKSGLIEEYVLDAPYSRFTEALRDVKASIDSALVGRHGKIIGIVSTSPDEGKTMVATNLASLIVASGARCLLIDSDLHLQKLSAALAPNARVGFLDALEDPSQLRQVVVTRERSGLDVLPCAAPARIPNAAELLGSPEMGQLLAVATRAYDYVVIEIAPIMSVVDVKKIERFIDAFAFIVEWGQTKQGLVADALSDTPMIHDRLVSFVLNKADPVALKQADLLKGNKVRRYYQD